MIDIMNFKGIQRGTCARYVYGPQLFGGDQEHLGEGVAPSTYTLEKNDAIFS